MFKGLLTHSQLPPLRLSLCFSLDPLPFDTRVAAAASSTTTAKRPPKSQEGGRAEAAIIFSLWGAATVVCWRHCCSCSSRYGLLQGPFPSSACLSFSYKASLGGYPRMPVNHIKWTFTPIPLLAHVRPNHSTPFAYGSHYAVFTPPTHIQRMPLEREREREMLFSLSLGKEMAKAQRKPPSPRSPMLPPTAALAAPQSKTKGAEGEQTISKRKKQEMTLTERQMFAGAKSHALFLCSARRSPTEREGEKRIYVHTQLYMLQIAHGLSGGEGGLVLKYEAKIRCQKYVHAEHSVVYLTNRIYGGRQTESLLYS